MSVGAGKNKSREALENEIDSFLITRKNKIRIFERIEERIALFSLLTDYYRLYIYPNQPLDSYDLPLMETAIACIKIFDKTKGKFLHLFNGEMKKAMRRAKAKEKADAKRQGLTLSRDDERLIRKIIAFAQTRSLDIYEPVARKKIAAAFRLTPEKVAKLLYINDDAVAVPSTVQNDGEQTELFDFIASKEETAEERLMRETAENEAIERVDRAFTSVQPRQKKVLSMLLTADVVWAYRCDIRTAKKALQNKSLFSEQVLRYYTEHAALPTKKQIGTLCGVSEQSVSRTYTNFKKKLTKIHENSDRK
ncbi:MAG: hypothetical protein HFE47_04615 [Clostridia bacterium]|nr:hypothetical protein [Clostridia bacterium]